MCVCGWMLPHVKSSFPFEIDVMTALFKADGSSGQFFFRCHTPHRQIWWLNGNFCPSFPDSKPPECVVPQKNKSQKWENRGRTAGSYVGKIISQLLANDDGKPGRKKHSKATCVVGCALIENAAYIVTQSCETTRAFIRV